MLNKPVGIGDRGITPRMLCDTPGPMMCVVVVDIVVFIVTRTDHDVQLVAIRRIVNGMELLPEIAHVEDYAWGGARDVDVATGEEVVSDDHVLAARVGDEAYRSRVDVLVGDGDVEELGGELLYSA